MAINPASTLQLLYNLGLLLPGVRSGLPFIVHINARLFVVSVHLDQPPYLIIVPLTAYASAYESTYAPVAALQAATPLGYEHG